MQAAIVLLADYAVENAARRIVFDLNTRYGVPFYASRLPAHVSLKQPFTFESMDVLEAYFDRLAGGIAPFEIVLDRLYSDSWSGYGILGFHVVETPRLRALHDQLNRELSGLFLDTRAAHDGSEYRFHLTVEMGRVAEGEENPFRRLYDALESPVLNMRFTASELGMFFYPENAIETGMFLHYRTQPLGG